MALKMFLLAVLLHLSMAAQEPCHWGDTRIGLNNIYRNDICPPRKKSNADGTCELSYLYPNKTNQCDSFCQVRTQFHYGAEQPFLSQGYYSGDGKPPFNPNYYQVYLGNRALTTDIKLGGTINAGATGGFEYWSPSIAWSQAAPPMPAVNNGTMCGYWTFVPIFREVCGTRTFGDDCPTKSQTKENVCGLGAQRQPVLSPMGLPNALAGETRFVQTDCNTHLPIDQSNGTTSNGTDSAPLPPDLRKYYTEFWRRSKNSQGGLPSTNLKYTSCSSPVGMPMNYDCLYAINMLSWNEQSSARFVKPANTAIHSKTSTVTLFTCQLNVVLDEDWGKGNGTCTDNVSYLEVVAAAQTVLRTCDDHGVIGGSQVIRQVGDCGCHVEFSTPTEL